MCGIVGVFDTTASTRGDELDGIVRSMRDALAHRGPDDAGAWCDPIAGIGLGHRRLAVIDLSPGGHQPRCSPDGRHAIVFNGQVYNHRALRPGLEAAGWRFDSRSDTEVLLAALVTWGADQALARCNGMFAFAWWDGASRRLVAARDRLGEKPLYHAMVGGQFVFASELDALRRHPAIGTAVDHDALASYLRLGYVPHPRTILRGVSQLAPGHSVEVHAGAAAAVSRPYWSLADTVRAAIGRRGGVSDAEAIEATEALVAEAVALRLESDVPLGAFLSGGVDSSLVAAMAQRSLGGSLRTFTVAMPDVGFDESTDAAAVAAHLGTDHTTIAMSASDALAAVPGLAALYDEPFADPSALPTQLVSAAARRHVTVALSGDGGDEVFAGYNRHALSAYAWRRARRVPVPARRALAGAITAVPPRAWDRAVAAGARAMPRALDVRNPGDKAHKLARVLAARDEASLYGALVSVWPDPVLVAPGLRSAGDALGPVPAGIDDPTDRVVYLDTAVSLPDDMLTKVDRAAMAVGLEVRVPLLDHRLVAHAWSLPPEMRIRGHVGKWVLRQVLYRHVPRALVDRPKMGFDPPLGAWLRGPLAGWAGDLLAPDRLRRQGLLDPAVVRRVLDEHRQGRRNHDYALWALLMLQSWLDHAGIEHP